MNFDCKYAINLSLSWYSFSLHVFCFVNGPCTLASLRILAINRCLIEKFLSKSFKHLPRLLQLLSAYVLCLLSEEISLFYLRIPDSVDPCRRPASRSAGRKALSNPTYTENLFLFFKILLFLCRMATTYYEVVIYYNNITFITTYIIIIILLLHILLLQLLYYNIIITTYYWNSRVSQRKQFSLKIP